MSLTEKEYADLMERLNAMNSDTLLMLELLHLDAAGAEIHASVEEGRLVVHSVRWPEEGKS